MNPPIKVYVDTCVFGGVFDPEFSRASTRFFEEAAEGKFNLAVSALVIDELKASPPEVRDFVRTARFRIEEVAISDAVYRLRDAYIESEIIGPRWRSDALHVACATVYLCRAIVSWNFKHIVNFKKIPLYNAVNESLGYPAIAIHTPPEFTFDE